MPPDRSWLTVVLVIFGTRWLLAASPFQHGRSIGDTTHFAGGLNIRLLIAFVAPAALYGAGVVALSNTAKQEWWVSLVLFSLCGVGVWLWPEEIVTSSVGVSQKRLFGIGKRQISWGDVDYISDDPTRGIIVASKLGTKIVHTQLHVGHDDFLAIVKRHHSVF